MQDTEETADTARAFSTFRVLNGDDNIVERDQLFRNMAQLYSYVSDRCDDEQVAQYDDVLCQLAELVEAEESTRIDYMIDQAHNIEPKLEAMILSVTNLQEAYAKALLVDRRALTESQLSGDVLAAHRTLLDAYSTDVRPLCAKVREDLGGSADPVADFRQSGHLEKAIEERKEGAQAGWG